MAAGFNDAAARSSAGVPIFDVLDSVLMSGPRDEAWQMIPTSTRSPATQTAYDQTDVGPQDLVIGLGNACGIHTPEKA